MLWRKAGLNICITGFVLFVSLPVCADKLTVAQPKAIVRAGPGVTHGIVTVVQQDATFEIVDTQQGWHQIRLDGGKQGWMQNSAVQIVQQQLSVRPKIEALTPDEEMWTLVKDSTDPEDILAFLQAFSTSPRVPIALLKLKRLQHVPPEPPETFRAIDFYDQAMGHLAQQNNAQAITAFTRAIELNPNDSAYYINRSVAYMNIKRYLKAVVDLNRAIKMNNLNSLTYNNRGLAYSELEDFEKAIGDFNRAIQIEPSDLKTYFNRGRAYAKSGNDELAKLDYDRVIKMKTTSQ